MFYTKRRPYEDGFFEIIQNVKSSLPTDHIFYFSHGGNDIDNSTKLFYDTSLSVIFSLDLTYYKTRRKIIKDMESCNARLLWIGAELDPFDHPSIQCINWGSEFMLQAQEYCALPEIEKTPHSSQKHWISLALGPRCSRVYTAVCLLYYADLHKGEMRIKTNIAQKFSTLGQLIADGCYWSTKPNPDLESLYKILLSKPYWGSQFFSWDKYNQLGRTNNAANFDLYLRKLYASTMVEIVNETAVTDEFSGTEAPVFITEKFANSVHGLNFPIMCCATRSVEFLQNLGFDMFTDIIDISYDIIADPIDRIHCAIADNAWMLNDYDRVYNTWQNALPRLKNNRSHLKNILNTFPQTSIAKITSVINTLCS